MPWRADRREVVGAVPAGQDAGVDRRMQRLDPPVHHLGKAGHVGDVDDRQPLGREGLGGAAGGHQFDPEGGQVAAELRQTGLIRNTQNCTHIIYDSVDNERRLSATISAALGGPAS